MTVPMRVTSGDVVLDGDLTVPADATGIVLFAHGSGSSRFSPRNRAVARSLQDRRLATLLFDLLEPAEEREDQVNRRYRFDIGLLTPRLAGAVAQVHDHAATSALPIGLFGASTGAAVALRVAARLPDLVRAVVSRGGRPDLAGDDLARVRAPTLLIVGGRDSVVVDLNRQAAAVLGEVAELRIVPGATHLFEEPGAMEQVTTHAGDWFARHLADQ